MDRMIPEDKIKVTVLDLTPACHYELFTSFVKSRLPLRSLPIKVPQRPTHIAPNLYLEFIPFEAIISRRELGNFMEEPWLNIVLIDSESLSQYKGYLKPKLKDWYATVADKRDQEWLIVHIDSSAAVRLNPITNNHQRSMTVAQLPQMKKHQASYSTGALSPKFLQTSVLDKLKSDFDDKNHIVTIDQLHMDLKEQSNPKSPSLIPLAEPLIGIELIQKIKERIGPMFTKLYVKYDEEIRKLDQQRQLPGWNFCTFFLVKEGMAQALTLTSFHSDSLRIYDELEALFWQTYQSQTLNYFTSFGLDDMTPDLLNFLQIDPKVYRLKISQNNLPLFHLKLYIFFNQFKTLLKLEQFLECLDRGTKFLVEMLKIIQEFMPRDLESEIKSFFWVYATCLAIVGTVDASMENVSLDPVLHRTVVMKKLTMLELAKTQLNQLGVKYEKFPNEPPFNLNEKLQKLSPLNTPPTSYATILQLDETLNSIHQSHQFNTHSNFETFEDVYINLYKKIFALHQTLGWEKVGQLDEIMIITQLSKQTDIDYKAIINRLEKLEPELISLYQLGWNELIQNYLKQICLIYFNHNLFESVIRLCIKILPQIQFNFNLISLDEYDCNANNSQFLEFIRQKFLFSYTRLNRDVIKTGANAFTLHSIVPQFDENGISLEIQLSNHLLDDLPITDIQLALIEGSRSISDDDMDLVWFKLNGSNASQSANTLKLGHNELKLMCGDFNATSYQLEKLLVDIGRLSFILDLAQPVVHINLKHELPLAYINAHRFRDGIRVTLNAPYIALPQLQLKLQSASNSHDSDFQADVVAYSTINDETKTIDISPQRVRDWIWMNVQNVQRDEIIEIELLWDYLGISSDNQAIKMSYMMTVNDGSHWIKFKGDIEVEALESDTFELHEKLLLGTESDGQKSFQLVSIKLNEQSNPVRIIKSNLSQSSVNEKDINEKDNLDQLVCLSKPIDQALVLKGTIHSQLYELANTYETSSGLEIETMLKHKFYHWMKTCRLIGYQHSIMKVWMDQIHKNNSVIEFATSGHLTLQFVTEGLVDLFRDLDIASRVGQCLGELNHIIQLDSTLNRADFENILNQNYYEKYCNIQTVKYAN